jgi:hypothetical protein
MFKHSSPYILKIFTDHIGTAATTRLRNISISGIPRSALPSERRYCLRLIYDETYEHTKNFMNFCTNHPETIVVLCFNHIARIDDNTWLNHTFTMKEIIRGPQVLQSGLMEPAVRTFPFVRNSLVALPRSFGVYLQIYGSLWSRHFRKLRKE